MKKHFGKIKIILNILISIMVISFLLVVCLQRFSNNEISFFNFRMFTVASGSMAPQYNVGDILIAKETKPEDVKVGDSVTYLGTHGSFANKVVTHEVTSIEKKNGEYIFHTKGIANLVEDPPVYEEQLYGVIVYRPIILSFVYKIVSTKFGLFLFVIIPIFYIIGSEILISMLEREEKRRNKLKEKTNDDNDVQDDNKDTEKSEDVEENQKTSTEKIENDENKDESSEEISNNKKTTKKRTKEKTIKEVDDSTSETKKDTSKKSTKKKTADKKVKKDK